MPKKKRGSERDLEEWGPRYEVKDDPREHDWAEKRVAQLNQIVTHLTRRVAHLEGDYASVKSMVRGDKELQAQIESLKEAYENTHEAIERMSENFTIRLDGLDKADARKGDLLAEHKKMIGVYAEATERMRVDLDRRLTALEEDEAPMQIPSIQDWGKTQQRIAQLEMRMAASGIPEHGTITAHKPEVGKTYSVADETMQFQRGVEAGLREAEKRAANYMQNSFSEATIRGVEKAIRGEN
jgi:hypothetical protein